MGRWSQFAEAVTGNRGTRHGLTEEQLTYLGATFDRIREARSGPAVLRAAGVKIERMSPENLRIVAGNRQPWQGLAWRYRDMVPELRFALMFRANAISRVRFYVAEILDDDDEPIAVSMRNDDDPDKAKRVTLADDLCRAAEEQLARLPLDSGARFLGAWSQNFDVAGDCWLHGYVDKLTGEETWKIRSVEAVEVQGSTLSIKNELGQPRKVDLDKESLYRLWVEHPAYPHLGDSALNALQDVLEDICLTGREMRAVSRSRIMQNGILFVPSSMAEQRNIREDANTPLERRQQFMNDFTASMLAPIANEGDAGAVVPMMLTGTAEEIEAVRYERFEREDSPTLLLKLEKSLGRLANSLDIPPEILTGMADANHWTAWQIDNSTFRHHLEPSIRLMVDSATGAFLRTALVAQGFPPEEVKRVRIWYDAGQITENPNRRQDALDALDRILIGPAAGREALGFNDGDAPTPEEALQLIAAKNGIDQATAAAILAWAAREEGAESLPAEIGETVQRTQLPATRPAPEPAAGDPTAPGGTGTPDTADEAVAASAAPAHTSILLAATAPAGYRVDETAARDLADIDAALREQILAAADQAAKQALARAGNRLRSKATSPKLDAGLRAELQALPVAAWAERLGPDQCLKLNADQRFLLAGAWETVSGKFRTWVGDGIGKVIRRVLRMLKLRADTVEGQAVARHMRAEMEARMDTAWAHLQDGLDDHLSKRLFGTLDDDGRGEVPDLDIPPALVRDALAEVGGDTQHEGTPVAGLGSGSTVRGTLGDRGAVHVGMEWRYGYLPRDTFLPHESLDGQRFLSWSDDVLATPPEYSWIGPRFYVGDHNGCLCSYMSVFAFPETDTMAGAFSDGSAPRDVVEGLQREYLEGAP